jgi:hypothetical protein
MAKNAKTRLPPSPEARAHLLTVLRSTTEPLPARALAKLLMPPFRIAEADLVPILEEHVAAGTLYASPGKTPAGKPRYWDRDTLALGRAALLETLEQAEGPLAVKELAKAISRAIRFTESEVEQLLDEQVQAGRLHRFPAAAPKGKPRYWIGDPLEYGRLALRKVLDAKGPQTEGALKKTLKGLSGGQFDEILAAAIAARVVWRHPPVGKTKKELLGTKPPSPEPYLYEVGRQLAEIVARLTAVNVSGDSLRRALVQLIEGAGIPFAAAAVTDRESAGSGQRVAVDLIGLMRRIEPGAERGALVGARDLRRAAQLEKEDFDRAVLELARQGGLSLHRHDYATILTPAERDELVTDGAGTYYVGVALRQRG